MFEPTRFVLIDADPSSDGFGARSKPLTQAEIDALPPQWRPLDGIQEFASAKHRAKETT